MRNISNYPCYEIPKLNDLRELVEYGACKGIDKTIYYRGLKNDIPVSFKELAQYVEFLGTFFMHKNLCADKIAILSENSTEWCISFLAVVNSKNIIVPLDKELSKEDLAEIIIHAECKAIIYSEKYSDYIDYFKSLDMIYLKNCFAMANFDSFVQEGKDAIDGGDREFKEIKIEKDAPACITYTSGTSGKSKGVILSHKNLVSDVVATCQMVTAKNTLILLPLNHSFSWASAMLAAIVYLVDAHISPNLKRVVKDLQKYKPQNISAVPMMVEMLYKNIWSNAKNKAKKNN